MRSRGFTLIEVMVALFVIALGVGALLSTLVASADSAAYLREKAFAQWIALNRISELRLSGQPPAEGVTRDTVEYAGAQWQWEQQVSEAGIGGLLRVDVRVAPLRGDATEATAGEGPLPGPGRAVGFIGTAVARPSGIMPDWSPGAGGGPGGEQGDEGDDGDDGDSGDVFAGPGDADAGDAAVPPDG